MWRLHVRPSFRFGSERAEGSSASRTMEAPHLLTALPRPLQPASSSAASVHITRASRQPEDRQGLATTVCPPASTPGVDPSVGTQALKARPSPPPGPRPRAAAWQQSSRAWSFRNYVPCIHATATSRARPVCRCRALCGGRKATRHALASMGHSLCFTDCKLVAFKVFPWGGGTPSVK